MKTKIYFRILVGFAILSGLLFFSVSCKKESEEPSNPVLPSLATVSVTGITNNSAVSGGTITLQGSSAITSRGVCWSTSANPTISDFHTTDGSGTGNFVSNITGLTPSTPYYVRAYATNSTGTAYGNQEVFTTTSSDILPTLTTISITNITQTTASSGGNIASEGSSAVTARGVCWSTSANPTISDSHTTDGDGTGSFSSSINGLTANTPYYVRAYATNSLGTAYGNQVDFTTSGGSGDACSGVLTITDSRDGQVYPTVSIGDQCWLQKNMNYQTGNSWCYEDNTSNCNTYGRLYDWQTAMGVCPPGWHLPSDDEWTNLSTYLGGDSLAGGKMKETGTIHWLTPNTGATNSSGFTAVPGGDRTGNDEFFNLTEEAFFWSSSELTPTFAYSRYLEHDKEVVNRNANSKTYGFSARCVRD